MQGQPHQGKQQTYAFDPVVKLELDRSRAFP
jgi:hypothetical protein